MKDLKQSKKPSRGTHHRTAPYTAHTFPHSLHLQLCRESWGSRAGPFRAEVSHSVPSLGHARTVSCGQRGGNLWRPSDSGLILLSGIFWSRSAPSIGISFPSTPEPNKRWVSAATEETSQESGYVVLKCFEILSKVSRETQDEDSEALLGKFKMRLKGMYLNPQYARTRLFIMAENYRSLSHLTF